MKKESLADRLIRACEEKAKFECENQKLRENCIAWQKAYEGKADFLMTVINDVKRLDDEKSKIRDENSLLKAYNHLAKLCFERCGTFIVKYSKELGINDYLIKELGLDIYIIGESEVEKSPDADDILSLFRESSSPI